MVTDEASGNSITLGGHVLTLTATSLYVGTTYSFDAKITGNGTFTVELPTTLALFLSNTNDYSGTTNLNTLDYATVLGGLITAFGTSSINIGPSARVLFDADGAQTINNNISITPPTVTGTFLTNQIEFWARTTSVAYTVPHITLLGNARLGVNNLAGAVSVNLAGITTNNHCIQYGDENRDVSYFSNGPAACTVNVAAQPKAPDTGFSLIKNNPVVVAAVTTVTALGIALISRRLAKQTTRR